MKRFLVLSAIVAAAVVPGTTTAATTSHSGGDSTYAARGGQDLSIRFKLRTVNGKPTSIRNYKFKKLTAPCASGGPVDVKGQIGQMKINDNKKFSGSVKKGGGKVAVDGVVKQGGDKVKGTIRAKGKFGQAQGCDSGKVRWVAS